MCIGKVETEKCVLDLARRHVVSKSDVSRGLATDGPNVGQRCQFPWSYEMLDLRVVSVTYWSNSDSWDSIVWGSNRAALAPSSGTCEIILTRQQSEKCVPLTASQCPVKVAADDPAVSGE